jgi:hypothetical protein
MLEMPRTTLAYQRSALRSCSATLLLTRDIGRHRRCLLGLAILKASNVPDGQDLISMEIQIVSQAAFNWALQGGQITVYFDSVAQLLCMAAAYRNDRFSPTPGTWKQCSMRMAALHNKWFSAA